MGIGGGVGGLVPGSPLHVNLLHHWFRASVDRCPGRNAVRILGSDRYFASGPHCLNYFFVPPVYTFYVADPQNWVALITFESTALLVSRLSIQMEKQARTAILERGGMEKLYELSRRTLLMNPQQSPGVANCGSNSRCGPGGSRGALRCRAGARGHSRILPTRNWESLARRYLSARPRSGSRRPDARGGGCFGRAPVLSAPSSCGRQLESAYGRLHRVADRHRFGTRALLRKTKPRRGSAPERTTCARRYWMLWLMLSKLR